MLVVPVVLVVVEGLFEPEAAPSTSVSLEIFLFLSEGLMPSSPTGLLTSVLATSVLDPVLRVSNSISQWFVVERLVLETHENGEIAPLSHSSVAPM